MHFINQNVTERLASLGIIGLDWGAPLKSLHIIVLYDIPRGFSRFLNKTYIKDLLIANQYNMRLQT